MLLPMVMGHGQINMSTPAHYECSALYLVMCCECWVAGDLCGPFLPIALVVLLTQLHPLTCPVVARPTGRIHSLHHAADIHVWLQVDSVQFPLVSRGEDGVEIQGQIVNAISGYLPCVPSALIGNILLQANTAVAIRGYIKLFITGLI